MDYATISTALHDLHNQWWEAMIERDFEKAAYLANRLESAARRLTRITHDIYERKFHADTPVGTEQHPDTGVPPAEGNKG